MANAKKCDICGGFYVVPEYDPDMIFNESLNTSMIRVLRRNTDRVGIHHDVMQFDACEACLQDVLDYMLTKKAETEKLDI